MNDLERLDRVEQLCKSMARERWILCVLSVAMAGIAIALFVLALLRQAEGG